ncbi:TetR/AcrR family transcriptional regulator [Pseudonocardia spinosispora]|uniref:TetR/AcrR family transcriptional regulator n=1 Tax=Pseudonocardia spinosispora TaxID=103441 RepID=UPI00041BDCF4|nr:TetR/AcrR family transcriptional regulator [Pseudonocardia spinosispora]
MTDQIASRRQRLRQQTVREIKDIATRQMAAAGPSAISLRAIARDMGMTAGAIYGYFDTRDALITALATDVYNRLADREEAARRSVPVEDPWGRLVAVGLAYRAWAVGNPEEFQLLYGDPVPGYEQPKDGPITVAAHRVCAMLTQLVAATWADASTVQPTGRYRWSDFDPGLVALVRENHPELPPDAVGLAIRVWGRMHGLVTLEVYGHLRNLTTTPAKLYDSELVDLISSLGRP